MGTSTKSNTKEIKGDTMKRLRKEYINTELSYATLRTEDLIQVFTAFIFGVKEECECEEQINQICYELIKNKYNGAKEDILNEDIFYLLNEIAPKGTSFCSSEGDGSSFGFWRCDG